MWWLGGSVPADAVGRYKDWNTRLQVKGATRQGMGHAERRKPGQFHNAEATQSNPLCNFKARHTPGKSKRPCLHRVCRSRHDLSVRLSARHRVNSHFNVSLCVSGTRYHLIYAVSEPAACQTRDSAAERFWCGVVCVMSGQSLPH